MKKQGKKRTVFFITILIICTVCIAITISIQMNTNYEKEIENEDLVDDTKLYELNQEVFRSKFINSFNNETVGKYNNVKKMDENKEIIYFENIQEKLEGKYRLNTNIPIINIDNEEIEKYNQQIKSIFKDKIEEIKKSNIETIYTVDYMASINNNILSLAIKATLKEGKNFQRIILKTFNYDLSKEEKVKLKGVINNKQLKVNEVKSKIKEEVQKQNKQALELKKLGYDVFIRDITDDMFNIENINTYFVDRDGYLYIIYAYGNNNLTTEMDIIIF